MTRVSLKDVAAISGVSYRTVSRVVHGGVNVRPETRERIERAIAQLGYRPNSAAQALRSGKANVLGLMMSPEDVGDTLVLMRALTQAAFERGYAVTLVPSVWGNGGSVDSSGSGAANTAAGVDGIDGNDGAPTKRGIGNLAVQLGLGALIVLVRDALPEDAERSLAGLPVVLVGSVEGHPAEWSCVGKDQITTADLAVNHLLGLGHATVHHVSGPVSSVASRLRTERWREVLEANGRRVPGLLVGDWGFHSGYEAGLRLARDPGCTAVFASNDAMALGVIRALRQCGRRVPQEVSVVGVDDASGARFDADDPSYGGTQLTSVRQDYARIAAVAVDRAIEAIEGVPSDAHSHDLLVPPRLSVRGSTAAPGEGAGLL